MKQHLLIQWSWKSLGPIIALLALQTAVIASPKVPHTMEQRLAACSQCHGKKGQGLRDDPKTPTLAGKPAGYLYQQLHSFKTGQRDNPAMAYVVRQLTPAYLKKIARYYAAQPMPDNHQAVPDASKSVMKRGEHLVKHGDPHHSVPSCQRCHGTRLTGVKPMIPGIVGQTYDYISTQLKLWRSNERSSASTHCMKVVANRMTVSDVKAVSTWLAGQPLPDNTRPISKTDLPKPLPDWCKTGHSKVTP